MTDDENVNTPEAPLTLPAATENAPVTGAPPAIEDIESATQPADAFGFAAGVGFDPGAWLAKTFEFWDENLQTLTAHTGNLAQTRSFEEAIELQTRFAISRLDQLNRQIRELFDVVSDSLGVTTLCGAPRKTRAR